MNISLNLFNNLSSVKNTSQSKPSFKSLNNIHQDSFSFQHCDPSIHSNVLLFSEQLLNLIDTDNSSFNKIQRLARRYVPNISVMNIEHMDKKLKSAISNNVEILAYCLPEYKEGCKLNKITIYIPEINSSDSYSDKIIKLSKAAHEFSHCIQRSQDDSYMGLKYITGGDLLKTRCLNSFSSSVFSNIEQQKFEYLFDKAAKLASQQGISPQMALYQAYDCKDQDEFKKLLKHYFLEGFNNTFSNFEQNHNVFKFLPFSNSRPDLKKIVRNQCYIRALHEQEAYSIQKHIIQKYDPDNLSPTYDFSPIFYQEIANALE